MDFSLTADQDELAGLCRKILDDQATPERLKELEGGDEWIDRRTWAELGAAGLLGIALPEEHGGGGLGFLELAIVCEEVGRHVAPVPIVASLVGGALAIAEYGTDEQRSGWLPGAATGDAILTIALQEPQADPRRPTVEALADDTRWVLAGTKHVVPVLHLAGQMVVSATDGTRSGLYLVDPQHATIAAERSIATDGQPVFTVTFGETPAERLGDGGDLEWLLQRVTAALCVMQAGVSEQALRMTADYVSQREQFDHPLAAFQAVSQRSADAYIDAEAVRLTAWQAAWRLSEGLPAADEVAIAKFWAADGGHRVAQAALHLHGGIGVDVDYPIHRYFWWTKMIELTLGGPTAQLQALGASLADA